MVFDTDRRQLMTDKQQAIDSFQHCYGLGEAIQLAQGYLATLEAGTEAHQAVSALTTLLQETFDDHFKVWSDYNCKQMKKNIL